MTTIDQISQQHAFSHGSTVALQIADRTITFAELWSRARRIAGGLADAGLKRGERIAWLSRNHESGIELLVGACLAGVVLVPINWRLLAEEIAFILEDAEVRLLFAATEFLPLCAAAAARLPRLDAVFATDAPEGDDMSYASWCDDRRPRVWRQAGAEEIALQLYTSGTTGTPKGALLSHRSLLASKPLWRDLDWYAWQKGDVALVAMPMFHIGGMGWALMALEAGTPSLILPDFEVAEILRLADARRFTKTFMVPAALQLIVDHPAAAATDFGSIRTILYGASPMPVPLLERAMARIGCAFAQQYGLTETCGTIVALAPGDHYPGSPHLAAAGQALPGVEIEIRGPDGTALPKGQAGQIAIRASALMSGYWRRPDATAAAFDAGGWLVTGDAGRIDGEGYLYVLDRLNDLIISGGENVYPAEVESVLCGHPDVAEAAVIGMPDDRWGETVLAVIVLHDGAMVTDAQIDTWLEGRIARFKRPRRYVRTNVLPRNASGKILRRILRETVDAVA